MPLAAVNQFLKERCESATKLTEPALFIRVIGNIVGHKLSRLTSAICAGGVWSENHTKNRHNRLIEALQPEVQIGEIIRGVWTYFNGVNEDKHDELRVALAEMNGEFITAFVGFQPGDHPPRSAPKDLKFRNACYSIAKATGQIVIIEDVEAELKRPEAKRRMVATTSSKPVGSMLCYPVPVRLGEETEVPYVVSVCSAKPRRFRESEARIYAAALKQFAQRIALEHCLHCLLRIKNVKSLPRP